MTDSAATVDASAETATSNKPVFKHRSGRVSAAVFGREVSTKDGKVYTRFNTCIQRSYKDKNDKWQESSYFDRDDLFDVIVASQKAYEFIRAERSQDKG